MSSLPAELIILLILVLINGAFSMAEIALVSSRKAKLRVEAENGDAGAEKALNLAEEPGSFLSTIQIGITLVGILSGAYGGATVAKSLSAYLQQYPALRPYSDTLGLTVVVLAITYLSLVLGELVPSGWPCSRRSGSPPWPPVPSITFPSPPTPWSGFSMSPRRPS